MADRSSRNEEDRIQPILLQSLHPFRSGLFQETLLGGRSDEGIGPLRQSANAPCSLEFPQTVKREDDIRVLLRRLDVITTMPYPQTICGSVGRDHGEGARLRG